jgi:hypothetical protein
MMTKRIKDAGEKLQGGPLARHGGYSVAMKDELLRKRPEILRYLKRMQRDIVRDICPEGEEHLTAARRCILDRLFSKLATARLIEAYLGEYGILRHDRLENQKILEGEPILEVWLALNNQITKDLQVLGLDRKALDITELTATELAEAIDADVKGPGVRVEEAEAAVQDDSTLAPREGQEAGKDD